VIAVAEPVTKPLRSSDGRYAVYFHSSEHMPEIEDGSVSLVVTSPPYGLGLRYYREDLGPAEGQIEGPVKSIPDYEAYIHRMEPIWDETARKVAPGGYVVINVSAVHAKSEFFGESFMFPTVEDVGYYWRKKLGFQMRWKYYWLTARTSRNSIGENSAVLGSYPKPLEGQVMRAAEEIVVFRKPGGRELTPERAERRARSLMKLKEWRDSFNQVWQFTGAKKEVDFDGTIHMAPYPEELPTRIIRAYSCVDDLVLDPFIGTGTTLIAARKLDRRCVGYEVQPEWRSMIAGKTNIEVASLSDWEAKA
jgi:modification methylase